jgi:hypothetical protein
LLDGLLDALRSLTHAGCRTAYLDGSCATTKELPGDFDACWEIAGVDAARLDRELLDFSDRRAAQKARYRGELFPAETAAEPAGTAFLDYFRHDRDTGQPKGIVAIDLHARAARARRSRSSPMGQRDRRRLHSRERLPDGCRSV